jgi:hypothetical protein
VTVKRELVSPVPFIVGVVSFVTSPFVGFARVGVFGAVVSIVISKLSPIIVFPAGSVIVGVTDVIPSESHELGLQITVPDITGVGVHVHPEIVTVDPISAESTTSGVESLVRYGVVVSPEIEVILGASGAVVSIVIVLDTTLLVLPAESVRVTLRVLLPSGSGVVGVNE